MKKQSSEHPECDGVSARCATGTERQSAETRLEPELGLSAERLAELRLWIERRGYADPAVDRMIAARMLEQGDLE